jgi:hypothetical protein
MPTTATKPVFAPLSASDFIANDPTDEATINWIVGWTVALLGITLLTRTKSGYTFVYYFLLTLLVFLVLTQYKWIAKELGYATFDVPGQEKQDKPAANGFTSYTTTATPYGPGGMLAF